MNASLRRWPLALCQEWPFPYYPPASIPCLCGIAAVDTKSCYLSSPQPPQYVHHYTTESRKEQGSFFAFGSKDVEITRASINAWKCTDRKQKIAFIGITRYFRPQYKRTPASNTSSIPTHSLQYLSSTPLLRRIYTSSMFVIKGFTPIFFLNIVLHFLQVAGIAVLVARHAQNKSWSVPEGTVTDLLSLKFNLLPSWMFKIYGILLLYITQDLALRRESLVEQNLTNIHDKTAAWLGEVKAIVSLSRQRLRKGYSPWRIAGTFLYLACISILCTAASSLVTYLWVPGDPSFIRIAEFLPEVNGNSISDAYPILSALAVMDVYQVAFMAGVWNNMLFDPPVLQRAVVSNVSAVKFEVDCQALPNAAQSGTINVNRSANSILYPFHIDDSLEDVEFSLTNNMLNIIGVNPVGSTGNYALPTLLVASTIPIVDGNGVLAPASALTPSVVDPDPVCGPENDSGCSQVTSVQIVACDMKPVYRKIRVDGSTGLPVEEDETAALELNDMWSVWSGVITPQDPLQQTFGMFPMLSPTTNNKVTIELVDQELSATYSLSLLEETIMADLEVTLLLDPLTSIDLWDLNLSLGRALAAVYWRTALTLNGITPSDIQTTNDTNIPASQDGYKITVNAYAPIVALVASSIALITALILTWPAPHAGEALKEHKVPTDPGVLQIFWRAGKLHEKARSLVEAVPEPDGSTLREEGRKLVIPVRINSRDATSVPAEEAKPKSAEDLATELPY